MGIYKRGDTYWIDFRADGRRVRESVGPIKRLAEEAYHKRMTEVLDGRFSIQRRKEPMPFAEMADLYWELHGKQTPSADVTCYQLKKLKAFFGDMPLQKITIPDVLRYLNGVKERASAATANRHHNTLRAIFNRAIEWEKLDGRNPAARVKQFRVENSRTQFLENADITRLLAACDAQIRPIVVVALLTGMRRGEIVNLRWEHIDPVNGVIHVLQTKSGEPREIPIAPKLKALFDTIGGRDSGKVFALATRVLNTRFSKALDLAGIKNFRFHDLRHTFASHFIMRTNDLPATQKLLGHKSTRMTQRYAHLSKGHLQVGIQKFDAGWSHIWTPETPPAPPQPASGKTAPAPATKGMETQEPGAAHSFGHNLVTNGDFQPFTSQSKNDSQNGPVVEKLSVKIWSGRRESNPHLNLGKVAFYH